MGGKHEHDDSYFITLQMNQSNQITKRSVTIDVAFYGSGAIRKRRGGGLVGGVPEPKVGTGLQFGLWREVPDEEGLWNPVLGDDTVASGFQISIEATSAGYRELARYLLAISELDTTADPNFHEHHEVSSADGRTRLHIIVRKRSEGPPPAPTVSLTVG